MKIAYTGTNSRVGKELEKWGAVNLNCDVTQPVEIKKSIEFVQPDVIIHLACKSDVDYCEKEENKPHVINVNFIGFRRVATVAEEYGLPVVVISSEHIFDGRHGNYREDAKAKFKQPVNFYGQTKLAVEAVASAFENVKVVRTSTLFDSHRQLVKQYLKPLQAGEDVYAPSYLTRSFMYVPHFAESLYQYMQQFDRMPKTLHISGNKIVSWYTFVYYLADVYSRIYGTHTQQVHKKNLYEDGWNAPRPLHGGLDVRMSARLVLPQYNYMDGLRAMLQEDSIRELTNG